jgi:ABC-type glutathione transport system ATPase component
MHQASRPDDQDHILTVSDLSVSFGIRPPILLSINFSLRAREILFVCGTSGAGKSRLLRAIAELDPSHVRPFHDEQIPKKECGTHLSTLATAGNALQTRRLLCPNLALELCFESG